MLVFSKKTMASKKGENEDFETQFSLMRIQKKKTTSRELIKRYFECENELCDWIINLWKYSKEMEYDEVIEMYAFVNLELIKDHWDHEKYISDEFVIDHLLRNDPSFFNFEIFIQPSDLFINKLKIYDIIRKPTANKQNQPVRTTAK